MNPLAKKFISLFLVFSLMMLSVNLYAKERQGAKLIVTKKDGQQIEGELITVKPTSLLLLNSDGKDVSVDIADIKVIRVVKKSRVGTGALYGALIGGIVYAIEWSDNVEVDPEDYLLVTVLCAGTVAGAGALLGGLIGATAGIDKTFQIEGMTDSEIQETLDYLRKKARIRDYK